MTFNAEVFHKTSAEVNTQVASYFDVVDNAIAMSDTNKKYVIDAQASYSPSAPIHAGSFTTFIISPTCDNTADIYNGFIKANLRIFPELDQAIEDLNGVGSPDHKHRFDALWVGFKDAMDAVEKYEILANGISIYTQNFAPEESFITACGANESTKRADVYSKVRHSDIFKRKFDLSRCGAFIPCPGGRTELGGENGVVIPIKIDLRRFLPLSNIKYLPAFAGKLELKIMFGIQGLVYCPVGPSMELLHNISDLTQYKFERITCEFTQIGDSITMWADAEGANVPFTLKAETRRLTVKRNYEFTDCYSVIPNFGIDKDIYQALVQRYTQQELIFPTQILTFTTMSKKLSAGHCSSTQTITPRFIDSIFFLFPLKATDHTIFKNPHFHNFQLRCGGYGTIPSIPFSTVSGKDPMFIELCQNAMNVNGEQTGFNKEVVQSLLNDNEWDECDELYSYDTTSFFIGLPTETDNTFQQGQTTNTPITYEIVCDLPNNYYTKNNSTPPLMAILQDTVISIHVQPNGMPPVVEIGQYDITSR